MSQKKLSARERLSYGIGDLGNNILFGSLGFYLLYFLSTVVGLSPAWAGVIFFVERFLSGFVDLFAGSASDLVSSKMGRRRPFLLYLSIPMCIAFVTMWSIPVTGTLKTIIYCLLTGIVFNVLYSYVAIPYNSLLPTMSSDPMERTRLASAKTGLSFIGTLLAAAGTSLFIPKLTDFFDGAIYRASAVLTGSLAIVAAICLFITFFGTKERILPQNLPNMKEPLNEVVRMLWQREEVRMVMGLFACNMIAIDVITSMYLYYLEYGLKIAADDATLFMAVPLIMAVIVAPLVVPVSKKYGKFRTYIGASVVLGIFMIGTFFLPEGNYTATGVFAALIGVGISFTQVLVFSILPETITVGDREHGLQREGTFYGASFCLYKLGSAITILLVAIYIGWQGYVSGDLSTIVRDRTFMALDLRLLFAGLPVLLQAGSIYFVFRLFLTKNGERYQ